MSGHVVGDVLDALTLLNDCMDHNIIASAVEGTPQFPLLLKEMERFQDLIHSRSDV